MFLRLLLINSFSFVKRLFYGKTSIYNIIKVIPTLAAFNIIISLRALVFAIFFSVVLILTGQAKYLLNYSLLFVLLLVIPMFKRADFIRLMKLLIPFYIIICAYGIYHKIFGLNDFEIKWLESGLSRMGPEGSALSNFKRSFSTFAGVPEFTFFVVIYVYFFQQQKNKLGLFLSIIMLFLAGSRGLIVSGVLALIAINSGKPSYKRIFRYFLFAFIIYLVFIFVFPPLWDFLNSTGSRLLNYGTFNGRVIIVKDFLDNLSIKQTFLGSLGEVDDRLVWDNLYITMISKFGLLGGFLFISYLLPNYLDEKSFFFSIVFLSYGFYADIIYSFYFMFNFLFAMHSKIKFPLDAAKSGIIDNDNLQHEKNNTQTT